MNDYIIDGRTEPKYSTIMAHTREIWHSIFLISNNWLVFILDLYWKYTYIFDIICAGIAAIYERTTVNTIMYRSASFGEFKFYLTKIKKNKINESINLVNVY